MTWSIFRRIPPGAVIANISRCRNLASLRVSLTVARFVCWQLIISEKSAITEPKP